jgi:hypothetical protein
MRSGSDRGVRRVCGVRRRGSCVDRRSNDRFADHIADDAKPKQVAVRASECVEENPFDLFPQCSDFAEHLTRDSQR